MAKIQKSIEKEKIRFKKLRSYLKFIATINTTMNDITKNSPFL